MQSVAGIEAGGTKFNVAIGHGMALHASTTIPTTDPATTLALVGGWLASHGSFAAIGIASFGPIDLHPGSATFGHITTTPKPGWANTDVFGYFQKRFPGIPIGFDTDVNGAALGEHRYGNARGLDDFIYITIGTGIGGGGMANGRLLHGRLHPEIGHLRLKRIPGDNAPGICPFHGDCWEGLCCGPALENRFGMPAGQLPADHSGWNFTIGYTAQALANLTYTLSPQRIIIGGSVRKGGLMGESEFFQRLRRKFVDEINGYLSFENVDGCIVPPALGDMAGLIGALALAEASAL